MDPQPPAGAHADIPDAPELSTVRDDFAEVLRSAAKLQEVVPDAVLVGDTVSAVYAGHRVSFDHDHVLQLRDR